MCECIHLIEQGKSRTGELLGIQWLWAVLVEQVVIAGTRGHQPCTYSTFEVMKEGRRRSEKRKIIHSFCPFCGEKHDLEGL